MTPYTADASLNARLRRRLVRLQHRRPAPDARARAMVSFSFDDAPLSAYEDGARILESRGARGTYFVSAGLAGRDAGIGICGGRDAVMRAAAQGHEIACHTFSHLDCARAEAGAVRADLDRNLEALGEWGLPPPRTFAYPYGDVAAPAKRLLAERFALSRALHHGLVARGCDLNQAPAVGIEGEQGEALATHWMARAKAHGAWLILFTHGVAAATSRYGASTAVLARLVDRALADGLQIVTVAEGARRIGAPA